MQVEYFLFSQKRFNGILFSGLLICLLLIKPASMISNGATVLCILLIIPVYYLAKLVSRAKAIVSINNEEITVDWTEHYLLKREANVNIRFDDISDWTVDIWNSYYHYRFTYPNKSIRLLSLDKENGNANNQELLYKIQKAIRDYNESSDGLKIKPGKTFFQRPLATVLAFISAGALIFGWVNYVVTDHMNLAKVVFATIFLCTHIVFTIYANKK